MPLISQVNSGWAGAVWVAARPEAEPSQSNISNGTAELLCLLSLLFLVGLVAWMVTRGRPPSNRTPGPGPLSRHDRTTDPWAAIPTSEMASEADAALVAADDSLQTSQQEMDFATKTYGVQSTGDLADALGKSRADVAEAFRLRQTVDDETEADEPTRRARYRQIIEHCRAADGRLDGQAEAFDRLRNMEPRVERLIEELVVRREAAIARLPEMDLAYQALVGKYAPAALVSVTNNAAQFAERARFADRSLASAQAALTVGNRRQAALGVRATEEALGQMAMLLDGVETLTSQLEQASTSVQTQLSAVEADVAAGKAASAGGATPPNDIAEAHELSAALAEAEEAAGAVRTDMAAAKPDPFAAMRRLEHADDRLDRALGNSRDAATRVDHARSLLPAALPAAQAEVGAATNFITTRRGAIGASARTRLAEARRRLEEAVASTEHDPVAALGEAQQAESMAADATRLADDDVKGWSQPQVGGTMSGFRGAVLGGILIHSTDGPGGRRAAPPPVPSGVSSFGWGGMLPGSFGGPGTRLRVRF